MANMTCTKVHIANITSSDDSEGHMHNMHNTNITSSHDSEVHMHNMHKTKITCKYGKHNKGAQQCT